MVGLLWLVYLDKIYMVFEDSFIITIFIHWWYTEDTDF